MMRLDMREVFATLLPGSNRSSRAWLGVGWLFTVALGTGCAGAPADETERVGSEEQELASAFGNNSSGADLDGRYTFPWSSPGVVNVCFVGPNTGGTDTDAPDPGRMANAQTAINNSWARVTGLTFSYQGRCPSSIPSAWISVFLQEVASNGESVGGVGSRLAASALIDNRTDIETRFGDRPGEYLRQVAHEFGHALGFYHEMERNEADGSSCDFTGAGAGNIYGHVTPYDRDSIMTWSYCPSVRTEASLLSPLDALGGEMMYPKAQTGNKIFCGDSCFMTASGAVVRTNGAITIDWVVRGGNVDPIWHVGGSNFQPTSGKLAASNLPSSSNSVTMEFPDAFSNPNAGLFIPAGQQHPWLTGGGTVRKSNAVHAAIVVASNAVGT